MQVRGAWLTVNRYCNFRCPWCYAQNTEYKKDADMPLELAKELIDFISKLEVKYICLIGGEPTYHKDFFEILRYIKSKNIKPALVTNGYRFHDKSFLEESVNSGLARYEFSLKGGNRDQYKELTGADAFYQIVQAINNLKEYDKLEGAYSVTVSKQVIDNLDELASLAAIDNRGMLLTFCGVAIDEQNNLNQDSTYEPKLFVDAIVGKYERLIKILNDKLSIFNSIPQCIWPKDFFNMLKDKHQISSGCHVQKREGLIFDTDGSVIICNHLNRFPTGKFGVDFKSLDQFREFWGKKELKSIYDSIMNFPSQKCVSCGDYNECGTGCPLQWLMYNPANVI